MLLLSIPDCCKQFFLILPKLSLALNSNLLTFFVKLLIVESATTLYKKKKYRKMV